jgi:ABC-type uncharacterized transport system YnjBCD ATPase subunit
MMLPSGNDAATMIAEIGGCLLKAMDCPGTNWSNFQDVGFLSAMIKKEGALAVGAYLREMNRLGR